MSAIGNYIHYTAQGYLEHGTTKKGKFTAYKSQKEAIRKKALANSRSSLNSQEKEDLETTIESMMKPSKEGNEYITKARQQVENKMKELFEDALGEIDWETGNISFKDNTKNYAVGQAKDAMNIEQMISKMDALENSLNKQIKDGMVGLSEVKNSVQKLKQNYETVARMIVEDAKKSGIPIAKVEKKRLGEFRNELNKIIKEYAALPAIPLQKGTFFEHLIAQAPMVAYHSAEIEVGKVVGDAVENVKMDVSNFSDKYLTKEFKNILETTHVSQGKIDVEMQWAGKDIKVSAKNVNLNHRYVTLLSNSSLLFLLSDEPAPFVNHALNILASHRAGEKKDSSSSKSIVKGMRSSIIDELRLIIFYKALTGDVGGRRSANLFVVNDNKTGKVKVYDVHSLIDNANKNLTRGIAVKGITKGMKELKNDWNNGSPEARISGLLADVHSRKISVGLNTSLL